MADIFGPRGAISTTTAPGYGGSGTPGDTYAKGDADCALATTLEPDDWNFIIDNLRIAARRNGVDDSDTNDPTMLFQAILNSRRNLLVFPEIETATNVLAITDNANGTISVDAAQSWLWRGAIRFSSADFLAADRTLTHAASKIYHVRWNAPGTGTAVPESTYPNGRFEIVDMTAAAPVEDDDSYNSTYDRMLVARVETDGANAPTITVLKNKGRMVINLTLTSSSLTSSGANGAGKTLYPVWNLARTPDVQASMEFMAISSSADADYYAQLSNITRYGCTSLMVRDYATALTMTIVGGA